jgi:hypothetical protein
MSRYQYLSQHSEEIPISFDDINDQIHKGDALYNHRSTLTEPVVNPLTPNEPIVPRPSASGVVRPPYYHPAITRYSSLNKYSTNPYPY